MAPEPGREAEQEGEWVMGGTTVQPCFQRRCSASIRKIAWISKALRVEEKEELEELDAIAARQEMLKSRQEKEGRWRQKVCGAFCGGFFGQDTRSTSRA